MLVLVDTLASHHEAFRLRGAAQAQRCANDVAARKHAHQAPLLVHHRQPPDLQQSKMLPQSPFIFTRTAARRYSPLRPSLYATDLRHHSQPAGDCLKAHTVTVPIAYAYLRSNLPPTICHHSLDLSTAYCARALTASPPNSMHTNRLQCLLLQR